MRILSSIILRDNESWETGFNQNMVDIPHQVKINVYLINELCHKNRKNSLTNIRRGVVAS